MSAASSFFAAVGSSASTLAKGGKKVASKAAEGLRVKSAGGVMKDVSLAPQTTRQAAASVPVSAARTQRAVEPPLGPAARTASADINVQPGKTPWVSPWAKKTAANTVVVGAGVGGTALFLSKVGDYGKNVWARQTNYYNDMDDLNVQEERLQQREKEFELYKDIQQYNRDTAAMPGGTQADVFTPGMMTQEQGGKVGGGLGVGAGVALAALAAGGIYLVAKKRKRGK